jgi:hypothetical protein
MDRLGLGDGKADGIAHRALHRLSGNPCLLDLAKARNEWIIDNGKLIMSETPYF